MYKGDGDVNDPNNYRPICITSVVARVYERIHVVPLIAAMSQVSMPSPEQFGFTRQRSTHDAIFRFLSQLVECVDRGEDDERFSAGVFVDISKAYDKVWINGLLYKLQMMGVKGNLYYTIKALIENRTIQVVGQGMTSDTFFLTAGVPQGSILAPFLFLIYIHDIICTGKVPEVIMSLFADDIALLSTVPGEPGLVPIQHALDHMSTFARRWKLTFSTKKTNVVFFRPGKGISTTPKHNLTLTGNLVGTVSQYTYLGLILDDRLSLIPHLNQLANSTHTTSYMISRLIKRDKLPSFPVIRALVAHMLVPQLTYSFPFLIIENVSMSTQQISGSGKRNMYRIIKNNIIRPLCYSLGLPRNCHHASVFIESRICDIPHLVSLSAARLAYRWLTLPTDTTNEAAFMFRQYLTSPPRSGFHPFNRMVNAIRDVPYFRFDVTDTSLFTSNKRDELCSLAWKHQYECWRVDMNRSLPHVYPDAPVDVTQLPLYTQLDNTGTAAHRARLRFCRAKLRYNMHRLKFADANNPSCHKCNTDESETTVHTLLECSAYGKERESCERALRTLSPSVLFPDGQLSTHLILSPELFTNDEKLLSQVLNITGKFINAIYRIREF
jgi:hypothetical protein